MTEVGDPKAKSPFSNTAGRYLKKNAKTDSSQFAMLLFAIWYASIELVHGAHVQRCRATLELTKSLRAEFHRTLA